MFNFRSKPIWHLAVLLATGLLAGVIANPTVTLADDGPVLAATPRPRARLPLIASSGSGCAATGQSYGAVTPVDPYSGDAATQPDINLAVRGYVATTAYLGLVDYQGNVDLGAPQFPSLFTDNRTPQFSSGAKVYRWDWTCNCRGDPITKWDVTLLGMATSPGEIIRLPVAGYDIGGGYGAMVMYAEETRLTLKYTIEDTPATGYVIYLEHMCTDPNLLALYRQLNAAGRGQLPALYPGQPLGRARGGEIAIAVRDAGSLLDPRSRKDWWQGR